MEIAKRKKSQRLLYGIYMPKKRKIIFKTLKIKEQVLPALLSIFKPKTIP